VLAQSSDDASRLSALGCQEVRVVGNLKFDVTVTTASRDLAARWQSCLGERPVVTLASTRQGEESLWLQAMAADPLCKARLQKLNVLWLLVPRHPQRFDEVHGLLVQAGMRVTRRSEWVSGGPPPRPMSETDVLLGDSLGEMQAYYLVSQMALLGGSFAPFGGQNLIEAAACGCPVIMGPHTFNFANAAKLSMGLGAAKQVQDFQRALEWVARTLEQKEELTSAKQGTVELLQMGKGAVASHIEAFTVAIRAPSIQSN
jgi:3-deoxy-D-manno-octulosonic-acid transferase